MSNRNTFDESPSFARSEETDDSPITTDMPAPDGKPDETAADPISKEVAASPNGPPYRCRACSMEFQTEDDLEEHVEKPCHMQAVREWVNGKDGASKSTSSLGSIREIVSGGREFTLFGRRIRPRNFFTPKEDPTIGPVNFLSNIPEKHALGVGFAVTLAVLVPAVLGLEIWTFLAIIFGGVAAAQKAVRRGIKTQHARDAVAELGYTGLGSALAILVVLGIAALAATFQRDPTYILEELLEFLRFAFEVRG